MNIYTRTGDSGETSLYGGARVPKDDLRVWCYGTVDEAGSVLGVIHATIAIPELRERVREIQRRLFVVSAQLAADKAAHAKLPQRISEEDIARLEEIIDGYSREFGRMTHFVIPGETPCSALFHVARTVVRRCERYVTALAREQFVCPRVMRYLNRLSDALYVLAKQEIVETFIRKVAGIVMQQAVGAEQLWSDALCERLYKAAAEEGVRAGTAFSLCIADAGGSPLFFRRQPQAILASVGIAQNKAYTAAAMQKPTGELAALAAPGGSLFGLNTADARIVVFGGGFPLWSGGVLVGAVGVSGGSIEQDERIARAAAAAFEAEHQRGE